MSEPIRIGAKLPSSGPFPAELGIGPMAERLEAAGFASVWVSDHVVMTEEVRSYYPFGDGGKVGWDVSTPWYDAVVVMSMAAAATRNVEIGVAVLVLPQRHPVVLAKQAASLDALNGGRLVFGVGAGWMREEFEALGVPFDSRGSRMDEWMRLLADCWTGKPPARSGEHYELPAGVICLPTPVRRPPMLVGGMSTAAIRRGAQLGDGWLALQRAHQIDADELAGGVARLRRAAEGAGRDPSELRVCLRVIESAGQLEPVLPHVRSLAAAGVDEIVVDTDFSGNGDEQEVYERLRDASA